MMREAPKQFGQRKPTRVLPAHTPHGSSRLSAVLIVSAVVLAAAIAAMALL